MNFVTWFGHDPNWQRSKTVDEQGEAIDGHLPSMRRRFDEGASLKRSQADPAVTAGVLGYRLRRLHAYFDAVDSVCTDVSVARLAQRREEG